MFICNNLTKTFGERRIFNHLNLSFHSSGFYLITGRSGSGKSTLLNILAGIEAFDSGTILFGNKEFTQLSWSDVSSDVDYVAQTCYLPEYLTVLDNMRLVCGNDTVIKDLLKRYDLYHLTGKVIAKCSGGEKQRLAIVRSVLAGKKCILLDEPTAALDVDNKVRFFELLKEISRDKLIICVTHDLQAIGYCDYILDMGNSECPQMIRNHPGKVIQYTSGTQNSRKVAVCSQKEHLKKQPYLLPYIEKWYASPMRNHGSGKIMTVLCAVVMFLLCLCSTTSIKIEGCLKNYYKSNVLTVWSTGDSWKPMLDILEADDTIMDYGLNYGGSVNDGAEDEYDLGYDLTSNTLPFQEDVFRLSDHLIAGHYFTEEDQILLSYGKAIQLGNPESLIGKHIVMDLYGGSKELEIVGVFDTFSESDRIYLYLCGVNMYAVYNEDTVFLNSSFTNRYLTDETFYSHGQRVFQIYFKNFDAMKQFFKAYSKEFPGVRMSYVEVPVRLKSLFIIMQIILMIVLTVILPVTILFYEQSQKIELSYNYQIFAAFDYLGYGMKDVQCCFLRCNVKENLKRLLTCMIITGPMMFVLNLINKRIQIFPFEIFSFRLDMIILYFLMIIVFGYLFFNRMFKHLRIKGWYYYVTRYEDLI